MNNQEQELDLVDYEQSDFKPLRRKLILGFIAIIIILSNIPLKSQLDKIIYSSLNINSRCTIGLKDYSFEWFAPKIRLNGLNVPKSCARSLPKSLKVDDLKLYIRGLSFSPLGLSFKLSTEFEGNLIEAFIIPGISGLSILLESPSNNGKFTSEINSFNLNSLSKFIPNVNLSGDITISTLFLQLSYAGQIKDLAINIASKNFKIPTQKIMGFTLKQLAINSLLIQATQDQNKKIVIKKLTLGDENSPIIANFKGDIKLSSNIKSSKLNLIGELAVGEKLSKDIFILGAYLKKFDKKDKFYQIKIDGLLGKPKLSSPR